MIQSREEMSYERYLKLKISKLEKQNKRSKYINLGMVVLCGVLALLLAKSGITIGMKNLEIAQLNKQVNDYVVAINERDNEIDTMSANNKNMLDNMQKLAATAQTINAELNSLKTEYNTNMKRLADFEERSELYDKYDYALYYNGERTDITYQRIKNVEEYAKDSGMTEDGAALVLSLASTESHGQATAENSKTTAAGLGQLLYATAKFVYEDEMKNGKGTYNHSLALDPDLNLQMTTSYVGYLADYYNGDPKQVVTAYRGTSADTGYVKAVETKLNNSGLSLSTLKLIAYN